MSEKNIKILMTVMIVIACVMFGVFIAKDIVDGNGRKVSSIKDNEDEIGQSKKAYNKMKGIIIDIDSGKNSYVVRDYISGEDEVYSSDSEVEIKNEYGKEISKDRLSIGDVVVVGYSDGYDRLKYIHLDDNVTRFENLDKFSIGKKSKYIQIDKTKYRLSDDTYVYSGGNVETIYELEEVDILNVNIIDKEVLSINVKTGHGYINLKKHKSYIGESLIINDDIAREILADMKVTVKEGKNVVVIKTDSLKGTITIDVKRGKTVDLDVSKIKFEKKKEGYVTFNIEPPTTRLYIDGKLQSNKNQILLDYGKYDFSAELTGYDSIVGQFVIDSIKENIKLNMVEKQTPAPTQTPTIEPSNQPSPKPSEETEETEDDEDDEDKEEE